MRVVRRIFGLLLLAAFVFGFLKIYQSTVTVSEFDRLAAESPIESIPPEQQGSIEPVSATAPVETAEPVHETPSPTEDPNSPTAKAAALGLPAPPDVDVTSWEFILANYDHSIGTYAPPELVTLEGQGLDSRVIDPMKNFVAAARAEGLSVFLSSGYRDYDNQQYLYNRKIAQYPPEGKDSNGFFIVLPPGTSEHQTGLACDITDRYYEFKDRSLENTAMYQWMSQHCQEYGFIVRYPDGREDVTNVMYEPWHFRYVGVEAATYIMENNLCLEEFLALYSAE